MKNVSGFDLVCLIVNWLVCLVGLGSYAWGNHTPESLALGIFGGLAALFVAITIAGKQR